MSVVEVRPIAGVVNEAQARVIGGGMLTRNCRRFGIVRRGIVHERECEGHQKSWGQWSRHNSSGQGMDTSQSLRAEKGLTNQRRRGGGGARSSEATFSQMSG